MKTNTELNGSIGVSAHFAYSITRLRIYLVMRPVGCRKASCLNMRSSHVGVSSTSRIKQLPGWFRIVGSVESCSE